MRNRVGVLSWVAFSGLIASVAGCGSARMEAEPSSPAAHADYTSTGDVAEAPGGAPAPAQPMAMAKESAAGDAAPRSPEIATGAVSGPAPAAVREPSSVKAGEWDDNANYRDFQGYIAQQQALGIDKLDVSHRHFLVAVDKKNAGVPNCAISVSDEAGKTATLTTTASGRALFFPGAVGLSGHLFNAKTSCLSPNAPATAKFDTSSDDGATTLKIAAERPAITLPTIDLVFILDTTGSMSEEIQSVKDTIDQVVAKFDKQVQVRVALVEYKDRGDDPETRVFQFSNDLPAFRKKISGIQASGGGDTPENVNAGLSVALRQLSWDKNASARMAFLIADAPPHLDYSNVEKYSASALLAAQNGIKVFTISASGMDALGQAVFRQIAQLTGASNMFVLRGGAGAQSTGAGDAKSSCGGTHENFTSGKLDQLIVRKIKQEVASLKADPMRIAGRGQDENAKPCDKRILLVAE